MHEVFGGGSIAEEAVRKRAQGSVVKPIGLVDRGRIAVREPRVNVGASSRSRPGAIANEIVTAFSSPDAPDSFKLIFR